MARIYLSSLNPVALREMKSRVRGPKTLVLFLSYLGVLALVIFVVYLRKGASASYSYGGTLLSGNYGPTRNFETGQDIFTAIFLYLILMVAVVTPAICGSLISKEMEEGTYDLLLVTPVRGRTLVYGKLIGAVGYLFMLILATLPLTCIVFIFGGVEVADVAAGYAIVLMEALVFSVISLFFSALFRLTNVAVIFTYFVIALLLMGVPVISSSVTASINADPGRVSSNSFRIDPRTDPDFDLPKRILVLNPFASLGSVLAPNAPYRSTNGDDLQLFPNSRLFWGNPTTYFGTPTFVPNSNARARFEESKLPVLPFGLSLWQGYLLVYTAIGLVFLLLSMGAVKPLPGGVIYAPGKAASWLKKTSQTKKGQKKEKKVKTPAVVAASDTVAASVAAPDAPASEAVIVTDEAAREAEGITQLTAEEAAAILETDSPEMMVVVNEVVVEEKPATTTEPVQAAAIVAEPPAQKVTEINNSEEASPAQESPPLDQPLHPRHREALG